MQNRSNTSIYISEKSDNQSRITKKKVRSIQGDLIHLKKESPSMLDENFEPQLGLHDELSIFHNQEANQSQASQRIEESSCKQEQSLVGTGPKIISDQKTIWQTSGLNIIRIVSKFIRTMKVNTNIFQYKMIDERMINILGDKASSTKIFIQMKNAFAFNREQNRILSNFYQIFSYLQSYALTISPDNTFLLIIRIITYFLILANIFYFPLIIFLTDFQETQLYQTIFEYIPMAFFFLDSLFKLITEYYDQGVLVRDLKKIVLNYFYNELLLDLVCLFPSFLYNSTLEYMKVLRILKLKYLFQEIEEVIYLKEKVQGYLDLIKSFCFILYIYHFCACIWYFIGQANMKEKEGWMIAQSLDDQYSFEKYSQSLYFVVITTLTIGYGDILPKTTLEQYFVIILAFTGCSILGYTINNIGEILKNLNEKEITFKQQMKIIQQYLKDSKINQTLSLQIRKYFQYHLKSQIQKNNQGQDMMKQLSKNLKEQMQIELYKKNLLTIRIIKENCCEETLNHLCQYVKVEKYVPESILIEQGSNPSKLYMIVEGEVELNVSLDKQDVNLIKSLQPGSVIGQWNFLLQSPCHFSIKALKFSSVLSITYADFFNVLRRNKDDYEKISHFKDKMIYSNLQYGKKCYICDWIHYFDKCPFVFYIPNKLKILNSYNKTEKQNRQKFNARSKQKFIRNHNIANIRKAAFDFIVEENENEVDDVRLMDFGFTIKDSFLEQSGIQFVDEFKNNQEISERNVESSGESQISQKPRRVFPFKHKTQSILITQNSRRESVSNPKAINNTQDLNKNLQSNTLEIRVRKQSQASPQGKQKVNVPSFPKIESKLNFLKNHNNSSNFSQLQAVTNSNLQVTVETSQEQQISYKNEPPQIDQVQNINLDIDKLLVTKFYFTEGNISQIIKLINSKTVIKTLKTWKSKIFHTKVQRTEFSRKKLLTLKN